jgi:hypothetical protein
MYNAGEYEESAHIDKMREYCDKNVWPGGGQDYFGHWHYMHYYYSQVMYREPEQWSKYMDDIGKEILRKQAANGSWKDGYIGIVYTTAINATILQMDKGYLPIYQR